MSLRYILNRGDGLDAVFVENEQHGIVAERIELEKGHQFARLYRVAVPLRRDGARVEHWETRYSGAWYEVERHHLPMKLLDLSSTLLPRESDSPKDSKGSEG